MAVIQYSTNSDTFIELVERGRRLGLSEHQIAKYIMLVRLAEVTDDEILTAVRETNRRAMDRKTRARPLS